MKLSNQAMGTLMMTLQKCLMEQSDITGMLKDFDLQETEDGLVILNPPIVRPTWPLMPPRWEGA